MSCFQTKLVDALNAQNRFLPANYSVRGFCCRVMLAAILVVLFVNMTQASGVLNNTGITFYSDDTSHSDSSWQSPVLDQAYFLHSHDKLVGDD